MDEYQAKVTGSKIGCWVIIIAALVIFVFVALTVVRHYRNTEKSTVNPGLIFEPTVVRFGENFYEVPGDKAFIDGRDFYERPPVTVMQIPLWDSPSEIREVAMIKHGDEVELIGYQDVASGERYAKVKYGRKSGWILGRYLDIKANRPVGKQVKRR